VRPPEILAPHQLLADRLEVVVEHHHVVAVPAHAAADVQQDLRGEREDRTDLVRDRLGRVVVARVEREEDLPRERVRQVELVRADRVTLHADPEQLALDRVAVAGRVDRHGEDLVERLDQACARPAAVDRRVLHAVRDPEVRDAGLAERPAHRLGDRPARDPVLDPEVADALVGVGEREVVGGLRVREVRRVEVEADAQRLRPVDPAGEVLGPDLVAIDGLSLELAVEGVEVQAMAAGDERERLLCVGAQLVRGTGGAGVVPGGGNAAGELAAEVLEAPDVVALPAVQRHGHGPEPVQRSLGVHAAGLVALGREFVSTLVLIGCVLP
jgi:hypothetical protein